MSQSPLARTRRSLPAFSHAPSKLSKSHSSRELAEIDSPISTPSHYPSTSTSRQVHTPKQVDTPTRYRNATTSTSTPLTPKIHYSPYALSTPPQGMSKSSSIPFDMAASAKAARRAEDERRSSMPVLDTQIRRKRFVRQKPIWQRISSMPTQLYDRLAFATPQSIYDILPDEHLANPIALGIHAIHYLLVYPLFSNRDEHYSVLRSGREPTGVSGRWDQWENEGKTKGVGLLSGYSRYLFLILLLLLSVGNAAYLFTRFRTYDMQLRSGSDPIHSPHASPVPAPKVRSEPESDIFASSTLLSTSTISHAGLAKYARLTGKALWFILKFSFYSILSAFGKPQKDAPKLNNFGSNDKIQSLRVWDPPEFCLAFFCAFPPTSPILTHLLVPLHPIYTPLLHLSTTFLLSQLAQFYSQLVKDRMLLSAEVMREYDQRFVYKRVFANRVDRGVGTNESEIIW